MGEDVRLTEQDDMSNPEGVPKQKLRWFEYVLIFGIIAAFLFWLIV